MRPIHVCRFASLTLGLLAFVCVTTSHAVNGKAEGFEPGDPGVTSAGDAGTKGTYQGQAPTELTLQYLLTTIRTGANEDTVVPQSGSSAVSNAALSTFFNGIVLTGFEGSGVLIPFTVSGPGDQILSFDYDFLSNEPVQSTPRADFAFDAIFNSSSVLQGSVNTFATASAGFPLNLFGAGSPFQLHSGLTTLQLNISGLAPGTYTLGIGIEDKTNADHASGLLIDNVRIVPEASSLALGFAGAVLLIALRSRFKKA